ncbi:MAG: exodeoxyribonuclease VII large subunit [Rhodothermales bacterium]
MTNEWDPTEDSPDDRRIVRSIGELTRELRATVEDAFTDVWVEGELTNFKRAASGHCYFTLKDEDGQMRCVMWRTNTRRVFFEPRDGMLVQIRAYASLYEPRGELQLVAREMLLAGEGALQQQFELLKRKLEAEGLFEIERKQPLPAYPERIGVITSGTGAALHDILSILQRRFPQVEVFVCPVRVQGMGAAEQIADAIEAFDAVPEDAPFRVDVVIAGRGGGAVEDLWAFNEEVVARAIDACGIPVISAVGHEVDYTISDFVADVRAATPSMAAELAVPDRREVYAHILGLHEVAQQRVSQHIADQRQRVVRWTQSYAFNRPQQRLQRFQQQVDDLQSRLGRGVQHHVNAQHHQLNAMAHYLALLGPNRPLAQGYIRAEHEGQPIRSVHHALPGTRVTLVFQDGTRTAFIESTSRADEPSTENNV